MPATITSNDLAHVTRYFEQRRELERLREHVVTSRTVEMNIAGRYYRDHMTEAERERLNDLAIAFIDRQLAVIDMQLAALGLEIVDE